MELVYAASDEQNPKLDQTLPGIESSAARSGKKSPHKSAAMARNGEARHVSPAKMKQAVRLSGKLWVDNTDDAMGNLALHWSAALHAATLVRVDSDTDGYGSSSASP